MGSRGELEWAFGQIRSQLTTKGVDPGRVEELAGIFEAGDRHYLAPEKAWSVVDMLEEVAAATARRIRKSTLAEIREHLDSAIELCGLKELPDTEIAPGE